MMNHLTTTLAATLLLFSVSCTSKREYFTAQDYDRALIEEFQSIRDTAPKVLLYESMAVMDTIVDGETRISEFINVFKAGEHFTFSYHFLDTTVVSHFEDSKDDYIGFAPDTLKFGLDEVVRILRSDITEGCEISLYSVAGEKRTYPPYFTFDTERRSYYVDATTGVVEVGNAHSFDEDEE